MDKRWSFFGGGSRFLEIAIIIILLYGSYLAYLFTCRLKGAVSLIIFHWCFKLNLLKVFLIVFYFINSLFVRGKV